MCVPEGGSNIELMAPAMPDAPLSQSLQRFLDTRGEGLFALMLEAPVPDEEAEELLGNGLKVLPLMAGAGGRDIHPKSTHGVLIRVYPVDSFNRKLDQEPDPVQLSGIRRVLIAVRNIDEASKVYGEQLGLSIDPPITSASSGICSVLCHPPAGGEIELVAVQNADKPLAASISQHLEHRGEGMFALVLQTPDLDNAETILSDRGVAVNRSEDRLITDVFGARIHIEQEQEK
jgi:hypothetical protein